MTEEGGQLSQRRITFCNLGCPVEVDIILLLEELFVTHIECKHMHEMMVCLRSLRPVTFRLLYFRA